MTSGASSIHTYNLVQVNAVRFQEELKLILILTLTLTRMLTLTLTSPHHHLNPECGTIPGRSAAEALLLVGEFMIAMQMVPCVSVLCGVNPNRPQP